MANRTVKNQTGTRDAMVLGAFWASSVFSFIMAILLLSTAIQLRIHDPITSPVLARMIEEAKNEPQNNTLKEEIRALDFLARKAYFTSINQLQYGAVLLLAGLAASLLLWQWHRALHPVKVTPPGEKKEDWWQHQRRSGILVAWGGGIIALATLISVLWSGRFISGREEQTPPPLSMEERNAYWPAFRGPHGNGVVSHSNLPTAWDGETLSGIRWKTAVPRQGNSSPIVFKDKVFLTGGDESVREVYCFSRQTGDLLWRKSVSVPAPDSQGELMIDGETGYAAPTPACDGQRVFAIFPTGELVCFDLEGKQIWTKHLGVADNHYGHSSSLITQDSLLFVQYDHYEGQVLALHVTTGETVWRQPRKQLSWSSPICVHTGSRQELILVDNAQVTSYDPFSGAVLWSKECMYGEVGPSPAYASGMVYATTEYSPAAAIAVDNPDSATIRWRWDGDLPSTASPVASEQYVFFASAGGVISCVSTDSGKTVWMEEFDDGFYSSPICTGNRIYLTDRVGKTYIFAVDSTYRELGSARLGESVVTTPAMIDNMILMRGEKHLFCIEGTADG